MDPQAAWQQLLESWQQHDWHEMRETSEGLLSWLERGGCPPDVFPATRLGYECNATVVRAACTYMADLANRVLVDPNGIPSGVPFSLTCFECSDEGPDTYGEAISAGWTEIEFHPECCAENFLGLCPEHSG